MIDTRTSLVQLCVAHVFILSAFYVGQGGPWPTLEKILSTLRPTLKENKQFSSKHLVLQIQWKLVKKIGTSRSVYRLLYNVHLASLIRCTGSP